MLSHSLKLSLCMGLACELNETKKRTMIALTVLGFIYIFLPIGNEALFVMGQRPTASVQ